HRDDLLSRKYLENTLPWSEPRMTPRVQHCLGLFLTEPCIHEQSAQLAADRGRGQQSTLGPEYNLAAGERLDLADFPPCWSLEANGCVYVSSVSRLDRHVALFEFDGDRQIKIADAPIKEKLLILRAIGTWDPDGGSVSTAGGVITALGGLYRQNRA